VRLLPQAIAWASAAISWAPSTAAVPVEVRQQQLADGVYQFTVAADGYVEDLNSLVVVGDADVLVFDTTTRPSTARTILKRIRAITRKPIRYVVNSHWHPDHWSGNEVFAAANPGVEIIATEQMRGYMLNMRPFLAARQPQTLARLEKRVAENHAKGVGPNGEPLTPRLRHEIDTELAMIRDRVDEQVRLTPTYPTLTYDDRLVLRQGKREIQLLSVTGDAAGTTVLYLPGEGILATGDTVSWPLPYYTPPIREQAASLRRLAALDPRILVPGHGPTMRNLDFLKLEAAMFEEVVRQVEAALRGGAGTIEEVIAKVNFDAMKARFTPLDPDIAPNWDTWTAGLVRNAFVDLRDSKEIPAK
jgi:cyclase